METKKMGRKQLNIVPPFKHVELSNGQISLL